MTEMTALVTGATGNVGSQVVRELRGRGVAVRAFVRDPDRAVRQLGGGADLAVGGFSDAASVRRALEGVDAVFLSSGDGLQKVEHETAVIDAAAAAGVQRIVKASTIRAEVGSPLPPFDWHGQIEQHLRRSAVPAVVLQASFYMTNLLMSADQIREHGRLFAPAAEGKIAMIDPRDVAAVAAVALTTAGHAGRTYVLTGPEALTYSQIAAHLSAATGRPIEFVDVPDAALRQGLVAAGMPDWLVEHLLALFGIIRQDALAETTDTVHALTGRSPRTFAEFARDHAGLFRT
jgi:uncharacterized protein YbjT (DUF2867 family)